MAAVMCDVYVCDASGNDTRRVTQVIQNDTETPQIFVSVLL